MREGWFGMFAHELMRLYTESETIQGVCMDDCDCYVPIAKKETGFWDTLANNMMNGLFRATVQDSMENSKLLKPQYDSWKSMCTKIMSDDYTEFVRPFALLDD